MITVTDHHGTVHAASPDARPGECICGYPPYGTRLDDPIGSWNLQGRDEVTCARCLQILGHDITGRRAT